MQETEEQEEEGEGRRGRGEGGGGGSSSCGGRCSVCALIHATCTSKIPAQGHSHTPEVSLNTAQTKNTHIKNKMLAKHHTFL